MKTLKGIIIIFIAVFLISCRGEDGLDGMNGEALLGSIFEIEGDFTSGNEYRIVHDFPSNFEIYDGDVVLVYILWEQAVQDNGDPLDVWRLLPQTLVFNDGILQYNYDYSLIDVQIFLDGSINLNSLSAGDTDNQIFRIAVLPAAFANDKSLDINKLNSLMNNENINNQSIERIDIPKVIE